MEDLARSQQPKGKGPRWCCGPQWCHGLRKREYGRPMSACGP